MIKGAQGFGNLQTKHESFCSELPNYFDQHLPLMGADTQRKFYYHLITTLMLKIIFFSFLIAFFFLTALSAQEPEIENMLEGKEEYSDVTNLLDLLAELENHPLDLNRVTVKQLALLPWISEITAWEIVHHRERFGKFNSVEELEIFSQIEDEALPVLKKYLFVAKQTEPPDFSLSFKSRVSRKIEQSKGLKNGFYDPLPEKICNRLIGSYNKNLKFGMLLEKDSGEKRLDDLATYFIKYSAPNNKIEFVLGNYLLEFGQGLVFWNPYRTQKNNDPIFAARNPSRDIHEYTLVDENASLYGIAGKLNFRLLQFFLFYSAQKIDATLLDNLQDVSSFYTSGYHRNEIEKNKKDQMIELLRGARLELRPVPSFSIGMTGYQSQFDRKVLNDDSVRQRFAFAGKENQVISLDYNYSNGLFNFFGEWAQSQNRGRGLLSGLLLDSKKASLTLLYRNYSKVFISLHGSSFGENSGNPTNERGFYFGLKIDPQKNLKLLFYFDQFKFPWRTYLIPMPINGREVFAAVKFKPIKKLWLYFHLRADQKDDLVTQLNKTSWTEKIILPKHQLKLRFQIDYEPQNKIKLRHRIEKNWVRYEKYFDVITDLSSRYSGILLYQDFYYQLIPRLGFSYRITFFNTDGYEARLYEIERDVPGILTNQMLYGQGTRWYIFARLNISALLSVSLKFSSTHYYFTDHIGTAADMIAGDCVHSINLQVETHL